MTAPFWLAGCKNQSTATTASITNTPCTLDVFFDTSGSALTKNKKNQYKSLLIRLGAHTIDNTPTPWLNLYGFSNQKTRIELSRVFGGVPEDMKQIKDAYKLLMKQPRGKRGTYYSSPLSQLIEDCHTSHSPVVAVFISDGGVDDMKSASKLLATLSKTSNFKALYIIPVDTQFRVKLESEVEVLGNRAHIIGNEETENAIDSISFSQ